MSQLAFRVVVDEIVSAEAEASDLVDVQDLQVSSAGRVTHTPYNSTHTQQHTKKWHPNTQQAG
jgi:hypothetical protein